MNARLDSFRQKRNVKPQDAINSLQECYYAMHNLAHEWAYVNLVVEDVNEEAVAPGADSAAATLNRKIHLMYSTTTSNVRW
jgi:hypothetical protein